jgi:hypothetical protein
MVHQPRAFLPGRLILGVQVFAQFELLKKRLMVNEGIRRLERITSPHTHPGLNLFAILLVATRVLATFVIRRLSFGTGRKSALKDLKSLHGSASEKDVLIIGSGPSARSLNLEEVAKRQESGSLIVLATNYFLSSPLAKKITPDYLVWADEVFHPRNMVRSVAWADSYFSHSNRSFSEPWETLRTTPTTKVVVPYTWKNAIGSIEEKFRFLFFDDESLEGISRNISPLRPRGYQGSTGVKALAIGLHLSPRRCFVIGLDLSNFRSIQVDAENKLSRGPAHVAGTDSGTQHVSAFTNNGIADLLYSAANEFLYLRTLFRNQRVTNLGADSLVDAFPRDTAHALVTSRTDSQEPVEPSENKSGYRRTT